MTTQILTRSGPTVVPTRVASSATSRRTTSEHERQGRRRAAASDTLDVLGVLLVVIPVSLALATGDVVRSAGVSGLAMSGGIVAGLAGTVLLVEMLILAARVPLIDRIIGQDKAILRHRQLTGWAMGLLGAHGVLIVLGEGLSSTDGVLATFVGQLAVGPYLLAVVSFALLVLVGLTSMAVARAHLPHEAWYVIHLLSYVAVVISISHQFQLSAVLSGGVLRVYWSVLLVALAFCVVHRVTHPVVVSVEHDLRIVAVTRESRDTVSYWIGGRDLEHLGAHGGRYLHWRFWTRRTWWHSHPFSLSSGVRVDAQGRRAVRVTIRDLGRGTHTLQTLAVGTRISISGPHGLFTEASRTKDSLVLVGAGAGIAPIRGLLDDTTVTPGRTLVVLRLGGGRPHPPQRGRAAVPRPRRRARHPRGTPRHQPDDGLVVVERHRPHPAPHRPRALDPRRRRVRLRPPGLADEVRTEAVSCGVRAPQLHVERF